MDKNRDYWRQRKEPWEFDDMENKVKYALVLIGFFGILGTVSLLLIL